MSGIFGVVSKGPCAETLFYGTDYHSHLGTEFGGMAVLGNQFKRQIHDLSQAQFKSKFFEDYKHMEGNRGIGVVSAIGEQPIYLNSKFGPFCLVINGMVENAEELAAGLLKKGVSFSEMSTLAVNMAELIAKMKLIPIWEVIEGNSIVVCEDSIVRGTQLKNFAIKKLWDCGAKAIHVRAACPPLMFPCRFNLSTRSIHELAARRAIRSIEGHDRTDISEYLDPASEKYQQMVDWIANDLGVTTLRYQTVDDMVEAIGRPRNKLCLYCWTGRCPKAACRRSAIDIMDVEGGRSKKKSAMDKQQSKLW